MVTVVKIGGSILDSSEKTDIFIDAFLQISGDKILVHGGGKSATNLAKKLGVNSEFINGRRKTSSEMMDILLMCFSGINKMLVGKMQKKGKLALGLSGADFGAIPSLMRSTIPVDFGYVGDPLLDEVNTDLISFCFMKGAIPIFSALSWEKISGKIVNSNADAVALTLAYSLNQINNVKLLYAFEYTGVLKSIENGHSKIENLDHDTFKAMIQSCEIKDGMIPKLECGFRGLQNGIEHVEIVNFSTLSNGTKLIL